MLWNFLIWNGPTKFIKLCVFIYIILIYHNLWVDIKIIQWTILQQKIFIICIYIHILVTSIVFKLKTLFVKIQRL
jgi:hypothetical protein